jgi:uncharacterized protein YfaA (DUF2138 family)
MNMRICKGSYCSARLVTRLPLLVGIVLVALVSIFPCGSYGIVSFGLAQEVATSLLDLAHPDAIIRTNSLAKLPRDLLQVPLLRDVLTEDFLFYYEQNEGRLSLAGTLRRIAYEHDLDLGDWVIRAVIDEPAEVLFWKGPNGRLQHYLIAMSRNYLTKLLEMAAKVALDDKQLKKVEETLTVDGEQVPIFALAYAHKRTLFFSTRGDRMIILSDAGMLQDANGQIADTTRTLLAGLLGKDQRAQRVFRDQFSLSGDDSDHTIVATARYLSFGYQHFFPSILALRFDFGKAGWSTQLMFDPNVPSASRYGTSGLWSAVPAESSVCVALPVDWRLASTMLYKVGAKKEEVGRIVAALDGPGGVCWYPKSRLYTPLFVVPVRKPLGPSETALLARIFETVIGAQEASLEDKEDARFPVTATRPGNGSHLWQRDVTSRYGVRKSGEKTEGPSGNSRFFRVTLAQHNRSLIFSPDDELVQDALAVADKKFPSLGEELSNEGEVIAVFRPASLGRLLRAETLSSLSPNEEPVLRGVAKARLLPRLELLQKYPAYSLVLPASTGPVVNKWLPVTWQALRR